MPGEFRKRELINDTVVVTHTVDDSHAGWRADLFLRTQYKHFSRNKLQEMIAEGRIFMRHRRLKPSTALLPGEELVIETDFVPTQEPAVDLDYDVLFEDDDILVIDKPGNLPVHPAGKFLFNTLLMALRRERAEWCKQGRDFRLIHRLDRETSGVILLAKSQKAAGDLVRQFRERSIEKRYYAVVSGHLPEDRITVDADIGPAMDSRIRLKMQAYPKGTGAMDALTFFSVIKRGGRCDLVDCDLKTGRQHQIRVHLESIGHPIMGDKLYGGNDSVFLDFIHKRLISNEQLERLTISRHALHSRYLRFFHESIGRWVEVESPLPADMEGLLSL